MLTEIRITVDPASTGVDDIILALTSLQKVFFFFFLICLRNFSDEVHDWIAVLIKVTDPLFDQYFESPSSPSPPTSIFIYLFILT